jgi:hypothetical protein
LRNNKSEERKNKIKNTIEERKKSKKESTLLGLFFYQAVDVRLKYVGSFFKVAIRDYPLLQPRLGADQTLHRLGEHAATGGGTDISCS